MRYENLRKIFHVSPENYEAEYERRIESEATIKLGVDINGHPAFLATTPKLYEASLKAAKIDKQIFTFLSYLPPEAIQSYMDSCLIEEIVATNDIEGVRSTRKEIGEVLDGLKKRDKNGRFYGIVRKYLMLRKGQDIPFATCEDVRNLYDELVLDEVVAEDPKDAPDGKIFRKDSVSVVNSSQIEVHKGVMPEDRIIDIMTKALALLRNESILPLARISAFHFLFGYAHPFYNGNGRMNRFVSSYLLSTEYESIVALKLSHAVKSSLEHYYKSFEVCEHRLNRGDVTPFVHAFSAIIIAAMEDTRDSLKERQETLEQCTVWMKKMADTLKGKDLYEITAQIVADTLYSPYGSTVKKLGEKFNLSRQTIYSRIEPLKNAGLLITDKSGHKTYLRIDINELARLYG